MLLLVGLAMGPQKPAIPIRLGPAQGVELVIAHDSERCAGSTHPSRNMKHPALVRSAIDEISDKNYLTIPVTKDATVIAIVRLSQQPAQRPHDHGYRQ
jgi:hypothetical protein